IDDAYSNAYEHWKKMGSPQQPTEIQVRALERSGQLQSMESKNINIRGDGSIDIRFALPRQGVSLIKLEW
ncbi:MAG TPA: hypothetical protein VL943_12420, partial [Niabella sp.]|nr:hypothetical protein [Niabella sp.]